MKSLPLLVALASLTLAGGARAAELNGPEVSSATAASAPPSLGRAALVELVKDGKPLCGGWRPKDGSCEDIGFMEVLADGQVAQTYRFKLSDDYEIAMRQTVKFEGNALCAEFRWEDLEVAVLREGQRAPFSESLALTAMLQNSLEEFTGKTICETYQRNAATGELTTEVTVDGERYPALDADYRILSPGDRIHLRGPDAGPELKPLEI
ncbi:MAG TPA: hypothetical protein VEA44_04930 [Caulobacter sp.]|nr:hypothetical protein [Caulobacter sp.]